MFGRRFNILGLASLLCAGLLGRGSAQDLSTNGWRLWLDPSATWVNDALYLPSQVVLASLPINPPTGGWTVLTPVAGIPVTLPGTVEQYYSATYPNGYNGVSWWWCGFAAPTLSAGQRAVLQFRSARLRAEVYCNGKLCGYNLISEIPFEADVTSAMAPGATTNVLAVRITNPGGTFSWGDEGTITWGTNSLPVSHGFGGLDASINLVVRDPIAVHDLAVLNRPNPQEVWLVSTLTNSGSAAYNGPLALNITSNSAIVWQGTTTVSVPAGGQAVYSNDVVVANATLWNLTNPVLYAASAAVPGYDASGAGAKFGFRWFTPTGMGGNALLQLNGNRIVLKSAISWGYWEPNGLYPTDALARQEVMDAQALGLNCLNFHRNLGHPNVLDQQDQLGLLRYQEAGGGGLIFPTNDTGAVIAPTDLTGNGGAPVTFVQQYEVAKILAMVRRDRSHPSLVLYCLSNETQFALTNPAAFWLYDQIRQIDPSRTVYLHSGGGLVVKRGETANLDVGLVNETGRTGPQTLTLTAVNPDGGVLFTTNLGIANVPGGNVFGQILATNLLFATTTNGTVLINGSLQPNGGTGDVLTNQVQLLVIDPTVGAPLLSGIAVCEASNQIRSTLSNVFGVTSLLSTNLTGSPGAIVPPITRIATCGRRS
jgi:hypothetical protein